MAVAPHAGELPSDLVRRVQPGSAVDYDRLEVPKCLAVQRFQTRSQGGVRIMTRDNDTDADHSLPPTIMSMARPQISVVVFIGERRRRALRCLSALAAQQNPPSMEIIVVDLYPQAGPLELPELSTVRYFPFAEATSIPHAKAHGARQAAGLTIAFLEDHCVPGPGWAAAVWRAFDDHPDVTAVAYAFRNLNPVNYVSRAFFVLAYGPWMAPAAGGPIDAPSWMNVAYRASCLRPHLSGFEHLLSCEFLFHATLRRQGLRFWHAAGAEVFHLNHPRLLGSCRDSAVWQRLFASARVRNEAWGWPRRVVYFCGAPLNPLVIAWRLGRRLWQRPELRRQFFLSLPLVLTVYTFGMCNEALGYLFGPGASGRKSIEVETVDPRGETP